jgi:hypothetical protein
LTIFKDEDRDEGRSILRAMMEPDEGSDTDMLTGGASELSPGRSNVLPHSNHDDEVEDRSLQGHYADYDFTQEELDFIEGSYGNSETFMLTLASSFTRMRTARKPRRLSGL